jgi:hypothetical protein
MIMLVSDWPVNGARTRRHAEPMPRRRVGIVAFSQSITIEIVPVCSDSERWADVEPTGAARPRTAVQAGR